MDPVSVDASIVGPIRFVVETPYDPRVLSEVSMEVSVMSDQEKILEVLASIRPAIQADGGDVEFLDYDRKSGVVQVRLMGACESCPISMMTLKEGIERRLQGVLEHVTEVTAV